MDGTEYTFTPTTQNEYFSKLTELYKDIDPNFNLDPSSPDGLKIAKDSETFGKLDQGVQGAYNSKDPDKSTGKQLETICALTGTTRSLGTPSIVKLKFTGTPGGNVVRGSLYDSGDGTPQWKLDNNLVIGSDGTVEGMATCSENGQVTASVGTITRIVQVVADVQSVINPEVPTLGTNKQTDTSLRIERRRSVAMPGNNQIDNIIAQLFSVENVTNVRVYENFTDSDSVDPVFNPHGLTKNSIAPVVLGGTDEDVAKAIFIKKNPGTSYFAAGDKVEVKDVYDQYEHNSQTVIFSRPEPVDMNVTVSIKKIGALPSDAANLIKKAIIDYAEGVLIDESVGFKATGYDINEDVAISQINTPINKVIGNTGSYIDDVKINNQSTGAIQIQYNQISRWSESNITVGFV